MAPSVSNIDLSGRTPIFRLALTQPKEQNLSFISHGAYQMPYSANRPASQQVPQPRPPLQQQQTQLQPPLPPPPPPQQTPQQSPQPTAQQAPQSTPQPALELTPYNTTTPQTNKDSSPPTKRRGRKLQEDEVLVLFNHCLDRENLYLNDRTRTYFWGCVALALKHTTKRNFSWQSCQQIVTERTLERRTQRQQVDSGQNKEEPMTDLVRAIDKWIDVDNQLGQAQNNAAPAPTLKRQSDDSPKPHEHPQQKRSKHLALADSIMKLTETVTQDLEPDTVAEVMAKELQGLKRELQDLGREMQLVDINMNRKLDLILQNLVDLKELKGKGD